MFKFLLHACASAALVITPLAAQENVPPPKKSPTPKTLPIPEQQPPETATTHNPAPETLNTTAPKKAARTTNQSPAQPTKTSPPADSPAATESAAAVLPPTTAPNDPPPPAKRKIPAPKNTKNTKNSPPDTLNTSAPVDAQATAPTVEKQRRLAAKEAQKLKPTQSASLLELINTGNTAALETIPGMDSARIKALRKARPFTAVPDLMAIPGLDPASFTAIIKWTKNGMPSPTAAPAP